MHSLHLGQSLAVAVVLSLTLLIVGAVGLDVGIRHGDVMPPDLNVSFSGLHIIAYTTDPIECQPDLLCPGAIRDYDVVWAFCGIAPDDVHETWHWILAMPLQR